MVGEALVSDSVDPLSGLGGPSLFPRTIKAPADAPVPADPKDLDSIHNFMKSLDLRSPQKLLNEAKKIIDGGAELLESNLVGFTENVSATNAVAAKGKDKPQERRPGLDLPRKRASFSLKENSISQPPVILKPTLDINHLQDPDEFFDAFERAENATKEIQKQLGGNMDNTNLYKPSNKERPRRQGLLGKSYNYKHRYSSTPAENDDMWMSSQETVYVDIPSAPKDESREKIILPDSSPDANIVEVELAASNKKTESEVTDILEQLLSCNDEDLEGDGALNLLQERLKIKPLDRENLYMTELSDVGRTDIPIASESWQKPHKSSVVIDSVLRNLSRKPLTEQLNNVSSPTPPRSPLASISLLKKKILQRNPMADLFSPLNTGIYASAAQSNDKILGQIDAHKDKGSSSEFDSHAEFGNTEPPIFNTDALEVVENADGFPEQFVHEDASIQRVNDESRTNASPAQTKDDLLKQVVHEDASIERVNDESRTNASPAQTKDDLLGQVDALKDLDMSCNEEPTISKMGAQDVMGNADSLPEFLVDENVSMQNTHSDSRLNEESNDNIGKTMNVNENNSNPSALEEESRDDTSSRQQIDTEQPSEVHAAKPHRGKRVSGKKRIRNAHPMKKSLADESDPSVLEEETRTDTSGRQQIDSEQLPEIDSAKPHGGKRVAGVKRMRDAHPMRKSLAEAGTTFENGVRRSKRIRMRPLEYWKGERFVYGCVGNSFKLLGVKYLSPGKDNENLKVKPYISSDMPEIKELLDLAARH